MPQRLAALLWTSYSNGLRMALLTRVRKYANMTSLTPRPARKGPTGFYLETKLDEQVVIYRWQKLHWKVERSS